jgi:thioredoxin
MKFVYYSAEWCRPCQMYWSKVKVWAREWDVELIKVDLSDKFIDGIQSVPTMDVIVDGELKLRVASWGPGTRKQILGVLS